MSDVTALLARLDRVRGSSNRWTARCPAHQDNNPSLSIRLLDDGRVLLHCFAGCGAVAVLDAIGLDFGVLFPEGFPEHTALAMRPRKVERAALILELAEAQKRTGKQFTSEQKREIRGALNVWNTWEKLNDQQI